MASPAKRTRAKNVVVNIGSSLLFSDLIFFWVFPLISMCRKLKSVHNAKFRLPDDIMAARNGKLLEKAWLSEVKLSPKPSVLRSLQDVYQAHYLLLGFYKMFWGIFTWTGTSVVLYFFVKILAEPKPDENILHILAVCFFLTSFLSSICIHQLYAECAKEGFRVKSALTVLVYKKAMVLARVKGGAGEVINIISSDVTRVQDAVLNFHFLWTSVIETAVILALEFWLLQEYAFTSLAIVIILIPVQVFLGRITSNVQHEVTNVTTQRVHIMSEVLTAVKLIKFYAWEKPFSERISEIRAREVQLIRKTLIIKALNFTMVFAAPVVIAVVAISLFSRDKNKDFTPQVSFTALSIFNTLRYPLLMLPQAVKSITGASVSLTRITQYLTQNEVAPIARLTAPDPNDEEDDPCDLSPKVKGSEKATGDKNHDAPDIPDLETPSIGVDNKSGLVGSRPGPATLSFKGERKPLAFELHSASFTWEGESVPSLHNISLKVRQGEVLAVIGDVGSGKSSLISALLGQMKQTGGDPIKIYGTTSYVPQEAWLLNFSLRENIIFGSDFNPELYKKTIHVCALERDLTLFAAGDETEIAERGANLSGGQRQRASLARAVYNNADIILLDDPLSAVDQAVGRHIFDKCVKSHLHDKTVVMVTHQLQYLEQVDKILHIKNGRVARYGTFANLMATDTVFAELINNHVSAGEDGDDDVEAMPLYPTVDNHISIMPEDNAGKNALEISQLTVKSLQNLNINQQTISSMLERNQLSVIKNANHSHDIAAVIRRNELTIHSISEMDILGYTSTADHAEEIDVDENEVARRLFDRETGGTPSLRLSRVNTHNSSAQARPERAKGDDASADSVDNNASQSPLAPKHDAEGKSEDDSNLAVGSNTSPPAAPQVSGKLVNEDTSAQHLGWGNYLLYAKSGNGILRAVMIVIFFFLVHSIRLLSDVWMRNWISNSKFTWFGYDIEITQDTYILVYIVMILLFTFGILARGLWFAYESSKRAMEFHNLMFKRIMRAPMAFFDATPLGRILSAFSKHQFHVDETMPDALFQSLQYLPLTIGAFILVFIFDTWSALPSVILAMIGLLLVVWAVPAENLLKSGEASTKPPIFSHLATSLEGLFSIRAYSAQSRFELLNEQKLDANHELGLSLAMLKSWTAFYLDFITSLIIYFVALVFAIKPTSPEGQKTVASNAGLSLSNVLQILVFLQWSIRMIGDIQEQISSVGVISYYSTAVKQEAPAEIAEKRPPKTWPSTGTIEFKNVVLKYHEFGVAVLKKVNFTIRPKEKVGIVGRTGSGKSTLLVSLLRIVELTEGSIIIDGIDIATLGLNDLREQVAIIPQEPVLFVGTIRSNLDPFSKSTDEEIWRALDSVHLSENIRAMPNKLNSPVIENGKNFSLGQRQLFCIARAIISHTKILVLDEATAAIDMQTDALIQTAIKENFADLTVLTIAHRLNTIIESDKVLVMEAGQAVEFDEPLRLLDKPSGHFAGLVGNTGEATSRKLREIAQAAHDQRKAAKE